MEQDIIQKSIKRYRMTLFVKRVVDLLISLLLCIALFVPCLVIGIVIKLQDGGRVFFVQDRVGKNGNVFKIIKFRTMREGSEREEKKLLKKSKNGFVQIKEDPRVTDFGRFLRKTSFDEIPQLLNVLKGDMSLIGPRPFITIETEMLSSEEQRRNLVYPGLTGLAQLRGRSQLNIHDVVKIDMENITEYSLVLDIKIFFSTIFVVLKGI